MSSNKKAGFFQTKNDYLDHYGGALGPYGIAVLAVLLRCRNKKTGLCCPSEEMIQRLAGIGRSKVIETIKLLKEFELVRVSKIKSAAGYHPHNGYTLLEPQVPIPARIFEHFPAEAQCAYIENMCQEDAAHSEDAHSVYTKGTQNVHSVDTVCTQDVHTEDVRVATEDVRHTADRVRVAARDVRHADTNKTKQQNEVKIRNNNSPEVVVSPLIGGRSPALPGKDFEAKKNPAADALDGKAGASPAEQRLPAEKTPDSAAAGAPLDGEEEGLAACLDKLGDVLPGLSTADVYRLRCAALKQKDDNPREALKVVEGVLASATEQKKSIQKPFAWALQAIRGEYKPRLKRSAVPSAPCAGSQGAHATKDGSATKAEKPGKTPMTIDEMVFGVSAEAVGSGLRVTGATP